MEILSKFLNALEEDNTSSLNKTAIQELIVFHNMIPDPCLIAEFNSEANEENMNLMLKDMRDYDGLLSINSISATSYLLIFSTLESTLYFIKKQNSYLKNMKNGLMVKLSFKKQGESLSPLKWEDQLVLKTLKPLNNTAIREKAVEQKHTARFYLNNRNREFELAKKIIGRQGRNMKVILKACEKIYGEENIPKDFLKLRLRGQGSSHREGNENEESNEKLHLCISAKKKYVLEFAIQEVKILLDNIYLDYSKFCEKTGFKLYGNFYTLRNYSNRVKEKIEEPVKQEENKQAQYDVTDLINGSSLEKILKYRLPVFKSIYHGGEETLSFVR